jgi:pimeloyl-ACP methyl ester carboxylesterase
LQALASRLPVLHVPIRLAAALLLGGWSTPAWRERLAAAMSVVSAGVWQIRLKAILAVDLSEQLARINVPVLYLQATHDRVVSPWGAEIIGRYLPKTQIVRIVGPHFLLQARPAEAVAAVCGFARELGLITEQSVK